MGMEQLPFWVRLTQHPAYDEYWQDQAVDRILARAPLTVPTLFVGSLWDQEDIYGAPARLRRDQGEPQRPPRARPVVPRPGQRHARSALGPIDWGSDTGRWFRRDVMIPFLDQYLKDGPPADIARVTAFEAGTNQLAAPRRLAARLRPRLPGEPHPALPRARPPL